MSVFERFGNVYNLLIDEEKRWAFERSYLIGLARNSGEGQGRVLDLACGTGFHSRNLNACGFSVTGVDNSPAMLEQAEKLSSKDSKISWINSDITNLSGISGAFDLALLIGNTFSAIPVKDKPEVFLFSSR